jgi:hypothetical protein
MLKRKASGGNALARLNGLVVDVEPHAHLMLSVKGEHHSFSSSYRSQMFYDCSLA